MRLGIRLQLLLALGSLLVLGLVPLFFAVAGLTRATMMQVRASGAAALGRAVAGHVSARGARGPEELRPLLDAQVGPEGVAALGVYDLAGALEARAGDPRFAAMLPSMVAPGAELTRSLSAGRGAPAPLLVVVPGDESAATPCGAVGVVVRVEPVGTPWKLLTRLVGLYTGVVALALLVFTYSSMTRLLVQPIDALSSAARRVADGARRLDVPRRGARELLELGSSLDLMTERMRADEEALRAKIAEIERYAQDLARAQERLVRSERLASVGRLAAGLAHEIGNPIAAILGLQEILLMGGLDEAAQRDLLTRMKRETERVHRVLRDLLDFARPAVRARCDDEPESGGSVRDALAEVASLVRPQKAFRGVELVTEAASDLPVVALSRQRMVQVLLNLLLNAVDAAPREGGRVTVRAARRPEGRVRIEVEDNGPGIAPEVRGSLFEPFVTTKGVGGGTGLGLAVCRGLVEAVGGTIAVEDIEEGGARFVVDLPAERA